MRHGRPPKQKRAHPPQLRASVSRLASQPFAALRSQFAKPLAHSPSTHSPPTHEDVALASAHEMPQPPHAPLSVNVLRHVPPQHVSPVPHGFIGPQGQVVPLTWPHRPPDPQHQERPAVAGAHRLVHCELVSQASSRSPQLTVGPASGLPQPRHVPSPNLSEHEPPGPQHQFWPKRGGHIAHSSSERHDRGGSLHSVAGASPRGMSRRSASGGKDANPASAVQA